MSRRERGYTVVELMLALGIFAIGVSGIIAMQKLTIVSNQHAKNLAIATHVAESWLDQLAADSTLWTDAGMGQTVWVVNASGLTNGVWQLPAWSDARDFGPGFDALGAPLKAAANARFCTHVRLTSLFAQAGNGLARAEVRVFWLRDGASAIANACTQAGTVAAVGAATDAYHSVIKVSAVRQHGSPK